MRKFAEFFAQRIQQISSLRFYSIFCTVASIIVGEKKWKDEKATEDLMNQNYIIRDEQKSILTQEVHQEGHHIFDITASASLKLSLWSSSSLIMCGEHPLLIILLFPEKINLQICDLLQSDIFTGGPKIYGVNDVNFSNMFMRDYLRRGNSGKKQ